LFYEKITFYKALKSNQWRLVSYFDTNREQGVEEIEEPNNERSQGTELGKEKHKKEMKKNEVTM
jgi:hypothetical protein